MLIPLLLEIKPSEAYKNNCVLTRTTQARNPDYKHPFRPPYISNIRENNSWTHHIQLFNCSGLFQRSLSAECHSNPRACMRLILEQPPSWSGSALPQVSTNSVSAAWTYRVLKNTGNLTTTRWRFRWNVGVSNLDKTEIFEPNELYQIN